VMARAILREAGIDARLALVHSGGLLREDVPGLDQFDHMVVYLPGDSEADGRILDPTLRQFNTPDALPPQWIGGRALVIDGETPGFVTMLESPDAARAIRIDRTVRIDAESGDASIEETVTLSPAQATGLRMAISATPATDRRRFLESILRSRDPRVDFQSFDCEALEDPFSPFVMRLGYDVRDAFARDGGTLSGNIPIIFERIMFGTAPEQDRNIGMRVNVAEECASHTRIIPPANHTWLPPREPRDAISAAGLIEGSIGWSSENGGDGPRIDAVFRLHPGSGSAGDFQHYQQANHQLLRALERRIQFVTGD